MNTADFEQLLEDIVLGPTCSGTGATAVGEEEQEGACQQEQDQGGRD